MQNPGQDSVQINIKTKRTSKCLLHYCLNIRAKDLLRKRFNLRCGMPLGKWAWRVLSLKHNR